MEVSLPSIGTRMRLYIMLFSFKWRLWHQHLLVADRREHGVKSVLESHALLLELFGIAVRRGFDFFFDAVNSFVQRPVLGIKLVKFRARQLEFMDALLELGELL